MASRTLLPALFALLSATAATAAEPPRLAVVIAIDQFRYDYLERFRPHYTDGGFARLLAGGLDFRDCTFTYASTKTAVGHATMATGANPDVHGIIANEWADRDTHRGRVSVEDESAPLVGHAQSTMRLPGSALDPRSGRSPRRMLASSLGDQLKAAHGPEARVFGVSVKDRSAILMAGARADAAYWVDRGRFVSSTYYLQALPAWAEAFNNTGPITGLHGATWDRLLDAAHYDATQGPDDADGELIGAGLDRTFPHTIDGGRADASGEFFSAFEISPFSNDVLARFARELIEQENLGADATPDLLCLSFSQIDSLGHNYGTDSHEMMDAVLRLDRTLAEFFAFLDARVGAGRWVTVITADHGAPSMPERLAVTRPDVPSGRIPSRALDARVAAALDAAHGAPPADEPWFVRDNQGYHLRPPALAARGVTVEQAAVTLRDALRLEPFLETAYTRAEILAAPTEGDSLLTLTRRSFFDARSPDVVFLYKEYFFEKSGPGTNHGSPWRYDRHVPLLWYGAGVPAGARPEPVGVEDLAPTLAALLGVPPPAEATGRRLF